MNIFIRLTVYFCSRVDSFFHWSIDIGSWNPSGKFVPTINIPRRSSAQLPFFQPSTNSYESSPLVNFSAVIPPITWWRLCRTTSFKSPTNPCLRLFMRSVYYARLVEQTFSRLSTDCATRWTTANDFVVVSFVFDLRIFWCYVCSEAWPEKTLRICSTESRFQSVVGVGGSVEIIEMLIIHLHN